MQRVCTRLSVVGNWPHVLLRIQRVVFLMCAVPELQTLCTADSHRDEMIRVLTEEACEALLPFCEDLYRASALLPHLKWVH